MKYIIAYDLGTGGTKASLFGEDGVSAASAFVPCETSYPRGGYHEQCPEDWWEHVRTATRRMLEKVPVDPESIVSLAVSGHSLGVVPVGADGSLLAEHVPIWSDSRAGEQAKRFFRTIDEDTWYLTTGNGFPAPLYAVFKMMWYKDNSPDLYGRVVKFLGTKDYINFRMTGALCTDHSYASGSGVYSLTEGRYLDQYIQAAGIGPDKLPQIYPSTHLLGTLLPEVAAELGLSPNTKVACGGVDNACMAVGAGCIGEGEAYTSLGTSAWVAVSSGKPVVSTTTHPYVFAHCVPGHFVSATAIFAAGNSYRWARDVLCADLKSAEAEGGEDAYITMDRLAESVPAGAHGLLFNPSLAGGSGLDKSPHIRGGFIGLDLGHTRADLIRATLEGVCLNLRLAMDALEEQVPLTGEMLIVGGGGKSRFWRGLFASIYHKCIVETNIGQDAGSLGAAAVAAVGAGLWSGFDKVKEIMQVKNRVQPVLEDTERYEALLPVFRRVAELQSEIGDMLADLQ